MTDTDLPDEIIERIWVEAEEAAISTLHAAAGKANPYEKGSAEAEVWEIAYRTSFARHNS